MRREEPRRQETTAPRDSRLNSLVTLRLLLVGLFAAAVFGAAISVSVRQDPAKSASAGEA